MPIGTWTSHAGLFGRNKSWTCEQLSGVVVRHCGHPTAPRPYYVEGADVTGCDRLVRLTFPRLAEAQEAAEAAAARASMETEPRKPVPKVRACAVDVRQVALAF